MTPKINLIEPKKVFKEEFLIDKLTNNNKSSTNSNSIDENFNKHFYQSFNKKEKKFHFNNNLKK